jgi:hypothetical protein
MLIPLAVQISAARVYGYNVLLFCFSGKTIYNTRNHNMTALYILGKMHIGFWRENISERNHLEDIGITRKKILNGCKKPDGRALVGLTWFWRGISVKVFGSSHNWTLFQI